MKHLLIALVTIIITSISSNGQEKLIIDKQKSNIHWSGSMLFGFGGHDGDIKFKEGYLLSKNGQITGGEFIVDMNSMRNTDGEYNQGLMEHLKNKDFFEVDKYPISKLVITSVEHGETENIKTSATLTIKGISKPVTFYAQYDKELKRYTTKFKVDRNDWGIVYGSKGEVDVKDYAISDAIGIEVDLHLNNPVK